MERSVLPVTSKTATPLTHGELLRRFGDTKSRFSRNQRQVATLLKMGVRKATVKHAAEPIGVSVDSLKDRWRSVTKKLRRAFPEFDGPRPSKSHTKSKKGSFIHWGLYSHASARKIWPVTHTIYSESGPEVVISTPTRYKGAKRMPTPEVLAWFNEQDFKEAAIARLNKPDYFGTAGEQEPDAPDDAPDLWKVFRPDKKAVTLHLDQRRVAEVEEDPTGETTAD